MKEYICRICGNTFLRYPDKRKKMLYCSHSCRGISNVVDPIAAFWEKVARGGGDECWLWTGSLFKQTKYGACWTGSVTTNAHRFSWFVHHGDIPDGLHVLHKCDNRQCVNPHHLFLGTNTDNIRDRVAKGRKGSNGFACGSKHPLAKLTEESVRKIREKLLHGIRPCAIASEYGISRSVVSAIAKRRTWVHVS